MAKKKEQQQTEDENFNFIVRIVNTQIVATKANVDPAVRMGSLSDEKVKEIEALVKSYVEYAPSWAINRQMDYETGRSRRSRPSSSPTSSTPPPGPSTGRWTTRPVPTCTCSETTWTSSRRMTSTG